VSDAIISRFIDQQERADFDQLATQLIARQVEEGVAGCELAWSELSRGDIGDWRAVPPIRSSILPRPASPTADSKLVSSAMRAFWQTLAPAPGMPILLLAASESGSTAGSLAVAIQQAAPERELLNPAASGKIDTLAVRSWLAARQRGGKPATIVATAEMSGRLSRFIERRRLVFRLPTGSRLFVIGTLNAQKGGSTEPPHLVDLLGLMPESTWHIVIAPTLTTPLKIALVHREIRTLVAPPHWVRYRLAEHRLVIMDLATTRFPACQEIGLKATPAESSNPSGGLIVQA
jgi:hypothetical protein